MATLSTQAARIGGRMYTVDTFEVDSVVTASTAALHYFNDGEGFSIGVFDPRLSTSMNAAVVLSRADAVAFFYWLKERGFGDE